MVPLVSLVSVVVSVRCCRDSVACGALSVPFCFCEVRAAVTSVPAVPLVSLVSLMFIALSVMCCGESGACGAPGVLGVHCCFNNVTAVFYRNSKGH